MTGTGAYVPCLSRHFGNEGKQRPPVAWSIKYGCENGHNIDTGVCDRCATSLIDGLQRCARCVRPMVVIDLGPASASGGVEAAS